LLSRANSFSKCARDVSIDQTVRRANPFSINRNIFPLNLRCLDIRSAWRRRTHCCLYGRTALTIRFAVDSFRQGPAGDIQPRR
jgi:hypothetical protein